MPQASKVKPRLGRGLSSLISVSNLPIEAEAPMPAATTAIAEKGIGKPPAAASASPVAAGIPSEIPVGEISPNPHQPRKTMDDASIAELAASLKSNGMIQPIVVKKTGAGYQLIAGERRLRAAKLAGLATVPAVIRDVDGFTQAQMALVENIQREDLNPMDRALGYRALIDQLGLTQQELAGRLGEDRSSIANFLRLLDLAEAVRTMVRDGRLSLGHAKLLAGVPDILEQQRLANIILAQSLSVRNLERLLQQAKPVDPPARQAPATSAHLMDLEKSLSRQLGMRVQVRSSSRKGRGRLLIHYSSLDEFDDLLSRLGVKAD